LFYLTRCCFAENGQDEIAERKKVEVGEEGRGGHAHGV
jgi:hypothetical protein